MNETEVAGVNGYEHTRRAFLAGAAATGAVAGCGPSAADAHPAVAAPPKIRTKVSVNGAKHEWDFDARVTLLDALRERMGLTGSKKGCDAGACGACTVLVDGQRINACLTLAAMCDGKEVTTVEGLANGEQLHPLQVAFLERDAFQCGFCTPGQLCSAAALLKEGRATSAEQVRDWMSGNLCRCGAYVNIVQAVLDVAGGGKR